jgi:xanthine/uracil permease
MSSVNNQNEVSFVGIDEKISVGSALFLGFQSILACNLFLGPIVIIAALSLNIKEATALITLTFLACGIASMVQSGLFLKYPIIQGASFAALGGVISIAVKSDFATCFGSIIISSLVFVVLGYFKVISKLVKKFIPPFVAGTVILVVGISLMFISWNSTMTAAGDQNVNFMEAGFTFVVLLILIQLGKIQNKFGTVIRVGSVIYALVLGTIFASFFGNVDLSSVASSPWIALPDFFAFGAPKFDINVILIMIFILFIVFVESIGTW